jgi:hypothetical protein
MTLQITPLSSLLLALSWQGDPGITYTLQTSHDLRQWQTLPYVVTGVGLEESYFLELDRPGTFIRLQFDPEGDSNENGLPDLWEWAQFGYLDVDPDADPDQDGRSTYVEWLQQTDPLDFFDAAVIVINISSGKEWLLPSGEVSQQALSISLTRSTGEPWANAPVRLHIKSGFNGIVLVDNEHLQDEPDLVVWTDSRGRIDPGLLSIHLRANPVGGVVETLLIEASEYSDQIRIRSMGGAFGPPPRDLVASTNDSGQSVFTWSGDPGNAPLFVLERFESGQWSEVIEIPTTDFSAPDPVDGTYQLVLQ